MNKNKSSLKKAAKKYRNKIQQDPKRRAAAAKYQRDYRKKKKALRPEPVPKPEVPFVQPPYEVKVLPPYVPTLKETLRNISRFPNPRYE